MDYEVELAVVLSRDVKNVSEEEAGECVLGYTCANDLTARKVQEMTSQWGYCKGIYHLSVIADHSHLAACYLFSPFM